MNSKTLLTILLVVFVCNASLLQTTQNIGNFNLRRRQPKVKIIKTDGATISTANAESNAVAKGGSTAISQGVAISNAIGTDNIKQFVATALSNAVGSAHSTAISKGKALATGNPTIPAIVVNNAANNFIDNDYDLYDDDAEYQDDEESVFVGATKN